MKYMPELIKASSTLEQYEHVALTAINPITMINSCEKHHDKASNEL